MHYQKSQICRVPEALPSAQYRTLGKYNICRVRIEKLSAKQWHLAYCCFAECHGSDTRRTTLFAESLLWALGTLPLCRVPRRGHSAKRVTCTSRAQNAPVAPWNVILCRVPRQSTRYFFTLPSAYTRALSKLGHVPCTSPLPWEGRDGHYCLPSA